jgi:hypothetical protein
VGIAFVFLCVLTLLLISFLNTTEDTRGTVEQVAWTRLIAIETFGPVRHSDWKEEIPAGAVIDSCQKKYHHTQSEPADNSEKVCGTPYTVDSGSGYGEVVQDCEYRVFLDFCDYTIDEWKQTSEIKLQGSDSVPVWPAAQLTQGQRTGSREERYVIIFSTPGGNYEFNTTDPALFTQYPVGSKWILNLNPLGKIVSIEPLN